MYLVLPSHALGRKKARPSWLVGWVLLSTRNTKDGGQNDSLCIATSEETVHRRTIVFRRQQLIPGISSTIGLLVSKPNTNVAVVTGTLSW